MRDRDSVDAYLATVPEYRPMSRELEVQLAEEAIAGNTKSRDLLITQNLRLVVRISREFSGYPVSKAELVQEGNIGLVRGVDKFDPSRGVRLSSFASWWIRRHMRQHVEKNTLPVHALTSGGKKRLFYRLASARRKLGADATPQQIADHLNEGRKDNTSRTTAADVIALEPLLSGWSRSSIPFEEIFGLTQASQEPDPEERLAAEELKLLDSERVILVLRCLKPREREFVIRRFMTEDAWTLKELADREGLTREGVRHIQKKALSKLRKALEAVDGRLVGGSGTPGE